MILGFTGTRHGLTEAQKEALIAYLRSLRGLNVTTVLHGGCEGADEEFHNLVVFGMMSVSQINVYPGHDMNKRSPHAAKNMILEDDAPRTLTINIAEPVPYAKRNARIVQECDRLIGCPGDRSPHGRAAGGTWQTIRMARGTNKDRVIIFSNGLVSHDENVLS